LEVAQIIIDYVSEQRTSNTPYDYVHWGITSGENPNEDVDIVTPYAEIGVTVVGEHQLKTWFFEENARAYS
jgi:hypothetical protein